MDLAGRYPLLHQANRWEWASITMQFQTEPPDERLVTSTHVVAFVGGRVILCRDRRPDVWFLPGGTREPGESITASLERELLEEAGARLLGSFSPIGAHVGVSDANQPYRPHLPHPKKAWLWGWAEAEIVGPPTMPDDGEQIEDVRAFPVPEAAQRAAGDGAWLSELILYAAECRDRASAT